VTEFDWTTFGFQTFQALSPLILVIITWAGANLAKLIKARVDNERLRDALTRLNSAVILAVNELNQTVVEEMKIASADGKITAEEKQTHQDDMPAKCQILPWAQRPQGAYGSTRDVR